MYESSELVPETRPHPNFPYFSGTGLQARLMQGVFLNTNDMNGPDSIS